MKFSYTIINKEGKKLAGTIDADNESGARDELNRLGFPVIELTEVEEEIAENIMGKNIKFQFEAIDQNGRRIVGTIAGEDKFEAFKRLVLEYRFSVEKIWRSAASLEEQEQEKNLGVVNLYTELKREANLKQKPQEEQSREQEQREKEKFVQTHVEKALEKVQILLTQYGEKIKDEERLEIQKKSDRLIRLKTSSNIEYVRHLAQELLMHIENIEKIFREDIPEKEKTNKDLERFHLEVKKTLAELEENRLESSLRQSILEKISQWKKQNMTDDVISGGIFKKITWSIYSFVQDILTEPPEISTRKEKINLLEKQLFSYYKLFIKEKSPEMRDEMKENIKNLRKEKRALKEEVSEIRKKYKEDEYIKNEESVSQRTVHELISLLGWILFFYLMYFFASLYASPLKESPSIKQFLEPTANNKFVVLLTIMFIVYAAAKGKRQFFPGKKIATIATWILTSMLSIFIILNFS